ncbi:DNA sulfur modification protein DndD [Longimicrobium sp.]|uniref:DNA sulfur modification protein DndD n=1 Tax=Longimicrobium sp. TaxID=2029185 RepID=UPI002E366ACF|nr:DNA sulfur modification protein DndD [Longimicrobium sp.]HEX6037779.1 DNA sulfur modification protein DndD [Longimicrobium sp.]
MILQSILLENFGLYSGRLELDLAPRTRRGRQRPIVLVGGKNGVGKTTLLEAIRLALYGRRALGSRVATGQYEEYLRGRIHRPGGDAVVPSQAAVGLDFDYAEDGVIHHYRVRRAWSARGRSVVESLVVEKDGSLVADVPREEWHHFLQELIPPGVSQLFFFDGERIQEIADGDHEEEHLATAIRGLLGIDLVSRLRTDLGLFIARQQRGEEAELAARLESIVRDLTVLEEQATELTEGLAELHTAREGQSRAAEAARRRFAAEGGELAVQRTALEERRAEVARSITRYQAELRELANGLLPFTVAPRLIDRFRRAARSAASVLAREAREQVARDLCIAAECWREGQFPLRSGAWDEGHWSDLKAFLGQWASSEQGDSLPPGVPPNPSDRAVLLGLFEQAEEVARPQAAEIAGALAELVGRERELTSLLARADNASGNVLLDELRLAEQRVGATEATLRMREEEVRRLRLRITQLDRERTRILEEQSSRASAEHRSELAVRASRVLADYERRLLDLKIEQLRGEFAACFNRIARKGDVIADVRVDPETFSVTLIDRDGREIAKDALSAGEKQVYAIAMLWALARTSGRALPMIIDTPLARLDSDHRLNLVERYFPEVSHQVVMLSTDTEVDAGLLARVAPAVSHAYHLEYDPEKGRTEVHAGYFWEVPHSREAEVALQQA